MRKFDSLAYVEFRNVFLFNSRRSYLLFSLLEETY